MFGLKDSDFRSILWPHDLNASMLFIKDFDVQVMLAFILYHSAFVKNKNLLGAKVNVLMTFSVDYLYDCFYVDYW